MRTITKIFTLAFMFGVLWLELHFTGSNWRLIFVYNALLVIGCSVVLHHSGDMREMLGPDVNARPWLALLFCYMVCAIDVAVLFLCWRTEVMLESNGVGIIFSSLASLFIALFFAYGRHFLRPRDEYPDKG